ncbi:MAG: hypothetical protein WC527_03695 [Candidatus Margulisiibacteriota bacterium]
MASFFGRYSPIKQAQGIGSAAYRPTFFANRQSLASNISSFGQRLGLQGAHSQTLDFMRTTGILKSGTDISSLAQIRPEHLRSDITHERLEHFRDFTSAVVSTSEFESACDSNEEIKALGISDLSKRINEALMSEGILNSLGVIDRNKVEGQQVALTGEVLHSEGLSSGQLALINEQVNSILSRRLEEVNDPFISSHGDSTLNKLWYNIKETSKWMGYGSISALTGAAKLDISYTTAATLAIGGALAIVAALSTAPPLLAAGVGLFAAGKAAGWAANHINPNSSWVPWLNLASRTLPLIGVLAGGIGIGTAMFQTNISLMHLAKSLGFAFPGALAYGFGNLKLDVINSVNKLKKSYGGQIDPGTEGRMKSEMEWAAYSIASEKIYLGVRLMLLAVSTAFMITTMGPLLSAALIAAPAAGFAATAIMRDPRAAHLVGFDRLDAFNLLNRPVLRNFFDLTRVKKSELLKEIPQLAGKLDRLFINPDSEELIFKRNADDIINKEFEHDDLTRMALLQIFRKCNQDIKDKWMIYAPLKGMKFGLWTAAAITGGLPALLAVSLVPYLALRYRGNIVDTIFQKDADTALKATFSSFLLIAPLMLSAIAATAAGISLAPIAAFAAFMGASACYLSELHGGGHSINTSEGFRKTLTASAKDLIGTLEVARRIKNVNTLIVNPHTGTYEHSLGVFFTMMFNTNNPNVSIVCMSDKQPYDTTDSFDKELAIAHSEKVLLTFARGKQQTAFDVLSEGIAEGDVSNRYSNLARNLRSVADWFRTSLHRELQDKFNAEMKGKKRLLRSSIEEDMQKEGLRFEDIFENPGEEVLILRPDWESKVSQDLKKKFETAIGWFDEYTEDAERVALQQLMLTADELEQRADRLEKKARTGMMSEADLNEEIDIVRCYDSDLVEVTTVTRKEIAGDERMVRKVENVATINLFRGLAIYKFWRSGPADNYPVTDWVSGTWTRVKNPNFRYGAKKGTLAAAKHIWIKRENVLTEVQQRYQENLSTSSAILKVDNNPDADDRFIAGSEDMTIRVNGGEITLADGEYYYLDTNEPTEQTAAPMVSSILTRQATDDITGTAHDFSVNIDGTIAIDGIDESQTQALHGLKMTGVSTTAGLTTPFGTISKGTLLADMRSKGFGRGDIATVENSLGQLFDKETDDVFRYKRVSQNFRDALAKLGLSEDAKKYLQTVYESMEVSPSYVFFGAYDYSVMMDKNDIEVRTQTLLPAILERERGNFIVDLIHKFKPGLVPGSNHYTLSNNGIPQHAELTDVEIVDANMELSYMDKDGVRRVIPYKIDRGALITWRKEGAGNGDPNKQHLIGAEVETDDKGTVTRFSLLYSDGTTKVDLDISAQPRYLRSLFLGGEIPQRGVTRLDLNAFFKDPFTEGDVPWLKVTYQEDEAQHVKFIRCPSHDRPMLYKKKGIHRPVRVGDSNTWDFGYFKVSIDPKEVNISDVCIPRGLPVQIIKAWARGLKEGDKVEDVSRTGDIYIVDGRFTVEPPPTKAKNLKGNIIGVVEGGRQDGMVIDLGRMLGRSAGQAAQVDDIIEIAPNKDGKLEVISRRRDASGLSLDSSAFVYNLTEEAAKRLEAAIPDLRWVDESNIEINQDGVILHYRVPGGEDRTFTLRTDDVADNFGAGFLRNEEMQVSSTAHVYTGEDKNFRPSLDIINGNLRLVVHKVDREEKDIALPAEIKGKRNFVIRPTTANSAVLIGGNWVPLNLDTPIVDSSVMEIDLDLSQVYEGQIKSVIGPQTRFGNWGDISLQYPRDPYFYGLPISAGFETIGEYGENFGLNRAKALRGQRGIQSGRTHTMPYTLLHNSMFADIMETNSEYYKKLSDYGHWLTGAGVSEDTQMEMVLWLMGLRMHVVKDMLTIMAAEKTFDKYKVQNTTRYNYSESLFTEPFKFIFKDLVNGFNPGNRTDPFYFVTPEAMAEITAGRTWYKYPWAKSVELSAIPTFLLTKGYVPFFPVDMPIFMSSWLFRTFSSMMNYKQQLNSLGYGLFETGLFDNPAKEIGYLNGYNRGAWEQWLYRPQFATFMLTSAAGGKVPAEFRSTVNDFFGATVNAEIFALTSVLATNSAEGMANNPTVAAAIHHFFGTGLGMAINMLFGAYIVALLQKSRTSLIAENAPPESQVTLKRAFKIKPQELSDALYNRRMPEGARKAIKKATLSILEPNKVPTTVASAVKMATDFTGFKAPDSVKDMMKESEEILKQLAEAGIVKDEDGKDAHFTLMASDPDVLQEQVEAALKEGYKHHAKAVAAFLGMMISEQKEKYDAMYDRLQETRKAITPDAGYSTLFAERDRLFNMLRDLDCVDKKGRISFGMQSKWRNQANEISEIMALIEMRICINAVNDIRDNHLPTQALSALRKVMATTQEHLVIDAASKMYRQVTAGKTKFSVGSKEIKKAA